MTEYTDAEKNTIRSAAFGAMVLVSNADPGFFSMFKESMAGAKALAAAPGDLVGVFKGGGMPSMPKGDPAQIEANVMTQLQQSTQILQAKSPQDLEGFRNVVATACNQVAEAHDGVKESEVAMINKIRAAIGVTA